MSDLEPSRPAQPPKNEAYKETVNPASRSPAERASTSDVHAPSDGDPRQTRGPVK